MADIDFAKIQELIVTIAMDVVIKVVATAVIVIGAAWAGLLANFAAGAFLIVLRPFKLGEFVTAGAFPATMPTQTVIMNQGA